MWGFTYHGITVASMFFSSPSGPWCSHWFIRTQAFSTKFHKNGFWKRRCGPTPGGGLGRMEPTAGNVGIWQTWEFNKKKMKNAWWMAYSSAMLRMVRPKKLGFDFTLWNLPSVNGWNPSTNQTWLQNRPRDRPVEIGRDIPVGPLLHHLVVCKGGLHPSCLGNSEKNKSSSFLRRNLMSEAKNHDIPNISQYCQANSPTVSPVLDFLAVVSDVQTVIQSPKASDVAMAGLARQSLPEISVHWDVFCERYGIIPRKTALRWLPGLVNSHSSRTGKIHHAIYSWENSTISTGPWLLCRKL